MTEDAGDGSDAQLWQLASSNPGAFGDLFARHADAVYNHCFRRTASWSVAEDLTSVVFLEAWRRRRDVALSGESILPWLLAVANNAVRNQARSLRRHRNLLQKLPRHLVEPDPSEGVDERIDDERQMQAVLAVFNRLPRHEQDVLALCVWSGLDYVSAAVALQIPVGTVRSRLSRARTHLREQMAAGDIGPPESKRRSGPTVASDREIAND